MRVVPNTFIYFIKPVDMESPIKIGCSVKPTARVISLMSWCPFPLELIATAPGGYAEERRVLFRFREHWIRSEWFNASAPILDFIEQVKATGKLPFQVHDGDRTVLLGLPAILRRHKISHKEFAAAAGVQEPIVGSWIRSHSNSAIGIVAETLENLGIPYPLEALTDGPPAPSRPYKPYRARVSAPSQLNTDASA